MILADLFVSAVVALVLGLASYGCYRTLKSGSTCPGCQGCRAGRQNPINCTIKKE